MEKEDPVLFQARYEYSITPKKIRIRAQTRQNSQMFNFESSPAV